MLHAEIKKVITANPVGVEVAEVTFFGINVSSYSKTVYDLHKTPFFVGITAGEQAACIELVNLPA